MDKTGLIALTNKYLNTQQQYLCVSRPRRFGKSIALQMLVAYYSRGCDSAELFHGFQIEEDASFGENLNQYDVIYLNMRQFLIRAKNQAATEYLEQTVLEEIRETYGELLPERITGIAEALERISVLTYNDENSLSCTVGLVYYSARKAYRLVRKFPTGKGFADVVFLPLLLEMKKRIEERQLMPIASLFGYSVQRRRK